MSAVLIGPQPRVMGDSTSHGGVCVDAIKIADGISSLACEDSHYLTDMDMPFYFSLKADIK